MIFISLLSLLPVLTVPSGTSSLAECARVRVVRSDEVADAIRDAGKDVAALLKLAEGYEKASKRKDAKRAYERVLELDSENERAREALRHQKYDGRWFESFVDLARYKREEAERMEKKGLARWKDEWVPKADVPFLRMGWVQDSAQVWMHPVDLEEAREAKKCEAAGHQYRADDNSWIAPADFERWTALEWKCGDEWLDMEAANRFHSKPENPWEIAGEHFIVMTTCDWNYGNQARWHADRTHPELLRLFGMAPKSPPKVLVLDSLAQYNAAAAGALLDTEGLSSLHGAYFADAAVDDRVEPPRFLGAGVSYWASDDSGDQGWGPYWLRWAAAQSYIEAIDPSWDTASEYVVSQKGDPKLYAKAYWDEKRIPRWLRYGAAAYVERYLANPEAAEGADPWDLRSFAIAELKKNGGLRKFSEIFAFELSLEDIPGSTQLYSEAGLLVSFLLDGSSDDTKLQTKLASFRTALASGSRDEARAAGKALERALTSRKKAIRSYAGL